MTPGEIEIADEADQGRQRPARLVAKDFFDFDRGHLVYRFEPGMTASPSVIDHDRPHLDRTCLGARNTRGDAEGGV